MSRTIAITGATGFIGHALMRRLAPAGWQIRALVRPASTRKCPAEISAQWIEGDLEDIQSLRGLVRGADVVVHCAGTVRGTTGAQFNRVNYEGVARLVQTARGQHPAPRFLLLSSLAAREPHLSPYAASKRKGENLLAEISGAMPWVALRPPAVYGPADRELLPLFRWMFRGIAPMIGSGHERFSLLFIEDLADAVVKWLDRGSRQGCILELHDGHPGGYSWRDVVDSVAQLRGRAVVRIKVPLAWLKLQAALNLIAAQSLGYAPMLTPGKVRELTHSDWTCDNTEFSKDTGWIPQTSLMEGLRCTLDPDRHRSGVYRKLERNRN